MPARRALPLCLLLLAAAAPAGAFEIAAGVGVDNLRGDGTPDYAVEARIGPFWSLSRLGIGLGAAVEADDHDLWAGLGPVLYLPLGERLRLEASVMLGGYGEGEWGNDLGAEFPMFRSQLGFSMPIAGEWRLGLAANHKSNASTAVENPGVESVLLYVSHRF